MTLRRAGSSTVPEVWRYAAAASLAAVAFFVLADVAKYWGGGLTPNPLWLATASTTALAVVIPLKYRWAVVAGGALGCVIAGLVLFNETLRSLALPCAGNTAESAIAVVLVQRAFTWELSLARTRRAVAWVLSALLAAFVGAVIGTLDSSSQVIGDRAESLLRWTLGDLVGLLLLPPLAVAFRSPWITPRYRLWWGEALAWVGGLIVLVTLSFRSVTALPYILAPVIMWIGIRFGPRLASPAVFLIALTTTYLTANGHGPFARDGLDAVVQVQALNVALALSSILASAHAVRGWTDQQRLRATLEAIPDVILTRDSKGRPVSAWGPEPLRQEVSTLVDTVSRPSDDPLAGVAFSDAAPSVLESSDNRFVEHRSVPVDDELSLHVFRDVTAERQVTQERRELFNRIEDARLETRERLARDLHDGPIQSLTASRLYLEAAAGLAEFDAGLYAKIVAALESATADLRETMESLAVAANEFGTARSLSAFGEDVLGASGINLEVTDQTDARRYADEVDNALLQIGREAILNAARHSGGTRLTIDLRDHKDRVELVVSDNGSGISADRLTTGASMGISSMRARAAELSGSLEIKTDSATGTQIRAEIPLTTYASGERAN